MEARAVARYVRVTPRKARQLIDEIRGRDVQDALHLLRFLRKSASQPVEKVLRSAIANAENNFQMNRGRLYVAQAYVDQGPSLKRIEPRARGMANRIRKRMSHITVIVRERE
ncbi:MAG: 50S ribosomal protein L22 [Limnochordaceae bacterium]|nr:50S ribosomal protein L22 [Limnochordaceae bacterium]